jgi:hypothetical protein
MLITAEQYQALLSLPAPANFTTVERQVALRIESALGRPLRRGTFYEDVSTASDRIAYPKATPVIASTDGVVLNERAVRLPVQVTNTGIWYEGGYAPYEAEDAHPCPFDLALAVAHGINTLLHQSQQGPDNVASMSVGGDYTVTLRADVRVGADGITLPNGLGVLADLGGRCAQLVARYRRIPSC